MQIPHSQQEAQDTVLRYLQRTVDGLPPDTVLDSSNSQGAANLPCDDNHIGDEPGPYEFFATLDVIGPDNTSPADLVSVTGELWHSWHLSVTERDGFEKPNRFAYLPDGYRLKILATYPPTYPPLLTVISPCFPGELMRDKLPFPRTIHQTRRS